MKISFFTHHTNPALLSLVNVAKLQGHELILYAEREHGSDWFDHNWTFPIMERDPQVRLMPYKAEGEPSDILFVGWNHAKPYPAGVMPCLLTQIAGASEVVILYDSQFGARWQTAIQEARCLRRHWHWLRKVRKVVYMHELPSLDIVSCLSKRHPMHIGPTIEAYYNEALRAELFSDWETTASRPMRLLWLGNRSSSALRETLVSQMEARFAIDGNQAPETTMRLEGSPNVPICWGGGIAPQEYYGRLRQSDFALCLPGVSWTHRPYEALACGAIPIVDSYYSRMHGVRWQDGENCIMVNGVYNPSAWEGAIRRALGLHFPAVRHMRESIKHRVCPQLRFSEYFKDLCAFAGI